MAPGSAAYSPWKETSRMLLFVEITEINNA